MAVTAARIGQAPLTIDWSNFTRVPPGEGTRAKIYDPDVNELQDAWSKLRARFDSGEVGYFNSPSDPSLSQVSESLEVAQAIRETLNPTDCLFLGIGGSALGPLSLLEALEHRRKDGVRFHFVDNIDPVLWRKTLSSLNPETTLVCIVTKSGGTFETVAQALCALEWLGPIRRRSHVLAITDPTKGELRELAQYEKWRTLQIAPSLGGRFSVFSPVGLFPLALAGLSAEAFLKGAELVSLAQERVALEKNPHFILAWHLIRHAPKRTVHVCLPYSTALSRFGDWWVQLWGESLGKDGLGFTPVAGVGATDQHSLLQLLRDGPDDKVVFFINVGFYPDPVPTPALDLPVTLKLDQFRLLRNCSFASLLAIEYQATSKVLARKDRPTLSFQIDDLTERSLGALYFSFAHLTSIIGTLMGVNPFDQPGVEEGKIYIKEWLSESREVGKHDS